MDCFVARAPRNDVATWDSTIQQQACSKHLLSQRHCERSDAIHLATCAACRGMDCFVARAPRNDVETSQTQLRDLAARFARGLPFIFALSEKQRAQGRPDARCTRGLLCISHNKMRTRAYRSSGEHPAFPAQWFYGLCHGRPGEASSIATIARESCLSTNLTPAFGRRTTRFCRPPPLRSSSQRQRPPHLTATYVTTADARRLGGTGGVVKGSCPTCRAEYF